MPDTSDLLPCVEMGPADATRSVVWLHGLGADGHDFAPIVPHVTEELYDHVVLDRDRVISIHHERFPTATDFPDDERAQDHGEQAVQVLGLVRRYKSQMQFKMSHSLERVEVAGLSFAPAEEPQLIQDLAHAARAQSIVAADDLRGEDVLIEGTIRVRATPIAEG